MPRISHFAIGNTPLVPVPLGPDAGGAQFFAKLEWYNPTGSLKDRIALHMIEAAEASGELTPDKILLEATSGNTGIALAAVAAAKGYGAQIVMSAAMSEERKLTLRSLGAELVLTPAEEGCDGAVIRAQDLAEGPRYHLLGQFVRPTNAEAHYLTTGAEVVRQCPELDCFVAGIGTGGTIMGVGRRLREALPHVKIAGIAAQYQSMIQGLMSLEQYVAPILDLSILDERVEVSDAEAFAAARELAREQGLFVGLSSGATYVAARKLAARGYRRIIGLFGDSGAKYLSTEAFAGRA
ncbi:MAG: cysteine synthase family protein [Armatimonadetes bacterium]|nr:cysteine synthase family protein [Armatimonadota bacterium]